MKFFPNLRKFWKESSPLIKESVLLLFLSIILILCLPLIFTLPTFSAIHFNDTGQIGETIGGIIAPFIAIIAAILTFAAFWIQYRANQIQIDNFNEQRKDIQIERFESKYYEMIKLHKENVNEIKTDGEILGRELFGDFFYEFYYMFYSIKNLISIYINTDKKDKEIIKSLDNSEIMDLVYLITFVGYGYKDEYKTILGLKNKFSPDFSLQLITHLGKLKASPEPPDIELGNNSIIKYQSNRDILKGYMHILGHYYRHLFQTVKYVDKIDSKILSNIQKYNYIKTLRAQFSSYEQLMLYYNALSKLGNPWLKESNDIYPNSFLNSYLIKYKMIKNIPLPLADFGIKPEEKFKNEIEILHNKKPPEELFEWQEILVLK